MRYTTLGKTGLKVSVMGLGCGGPSRLGISYGRGEENAIAVVRRARELGVNFFDTAEAYGTETALGKALAGVPREEVVLSTKVSLHNKEGMRTADELIARAEDGLQRLGVDYVDVLHLHGVSFKDYEYALGELAPALERLREQGKIRFRGITEAFGSDTNHTMLAHALPNGPWDVIMVGFNLINQSARDTVFPLTLAQGIGVLDMFAVRRALSNRDKLREVMASLAANGLVSPDAFDPESPLGFLTENGAATSIPDAAYRFCRDEPGVDVVLSGTGDVTHLEENAASLNAPPLPPEITERLRLLFQGIDSVSGN